MEKTPPCKEFRLLADKYIEGELTDAEAREFEAHAAECEECRRELEELRALKELLRSNREQVPDGLHSRIMNAVGAEPKPKRKPAIFRRAALSAACFFVCLSITIIITMLPMWNPSNAGGTGLPADPEYDECLSQVEKPSTDIPADNLESDGALTAEVEEILPLPEVVASDTAVSASGSSPTDTKAETMNVSEMVTPPAEEMTEAAEMTAVPETIERPAPGAPETEVALNTQASIQQSQTYDGAPEAEASSAPGGEEITLALLVVSGLLAVASFVAFLISLSSVRNPAPKKDKEEDQ